MRIVKILLVSGLICASFPVYATIHKTGSSRAIGTASARVVDNISVVAHTPLIFGYITPGTAAGNVTITTDNHRHATGNIKMLPGFYERAMFVVKGMPNRHYSMHAPQSLTFTAKNILPWVDHKKNNKLTVQNFVTYSGNLRRNSATGELSRGGIDKVYLGGTLVVPANAAPGLYSGLVPLTVSYE